jgi:hypothetical protein
MREAMHVKPILTELLKGAIHKKRIDSLCSLVTGVISQRTLKLSELGRNLKGKKERTGIRIVCRTLANKFYQKHSSKIYLCIIKKVVGENKAPDIIVDWSAIPNSKRSTKQEEYQVLRASYAAEGRSVTLYEEVHPRSKLNNSTVHKRFLKHLNELLPEDCKPSIITDAGFKNPWFKAVLKLGWNYIGRIRGDVHYDDGKGFKPTASLHEQASSKACHLGEFILTKANALKTNFYLYTHKLKGRKKLNRNGTYAKDKDSLTHAKGYREPFVIVSSLKERADVIIKKYKSRMTIEEYLRDTKSRTYGFNLNDNITQKAERYIVWLFIAALAALVAWVVGYLAEKAKLHYDFQANSYKDKRVLSFVYLGSRIIKKEIILVYDWDTILHEIFWGVQI